MQSTAIFSENIGPARITYTYVAYSPCVACQSCAANFVLLGCRGTSPGSCVQCQAGQRLNAATGCEPCPAGQYQQQTGHVLTSCSACPVNSNSPAGSDSADDCTCNVGFTPENTIDPTGVRTGFNCYCFPGFFVNQTECTACGVCKRGEYRHGCQKGSAGECRRCEACPNPLQKRAGCGYLSAGECRDKDELVRTPFCPVEVEEADKNALAISVRQASGLGAFSFEQVFGTNAMGAVFVCSTPCDGVDYDSIQCDGPFACNVKTCAEKIEPEGNMVPVRACPVVIEEDDSKETRLLKRRESCVRCRDCGHTNKNFYDTSGRPKASFYSNWGGGCVRECSKLQCSDNMIWDWTARKCRQCSELRSMELCNMRDRESMNLRSSRSVTGNWPLLHFPDCEGNGAAKRLESFTYGRCVACDEVVAKAQTCTAMELYPAACQDGGVECRECHRAGRAGTQKRVEVLKGAWYNSRSLAWEPLHCQISPCVRREDREWTGVGEADAVCTRECSPASCAEDEVEVPCRLPHDARCERVFPLPGSTRRARSRHVGGEVNLLNEEGQHRGFASFENTLIVLDLPDVEEFQCVWNANGIFDNQASPGGVSNVLWTRGRSDDAEYEERGTKVCREWSVERGEWMPLLPLQNTIGADEDKDSSRRMLVNTEAYVLSYRFAGAFFDQRLRDVRARFTDLAHEAVDDRMLRGAHVGGAGRLFLMMILREETVALAVNVPTDRSVHRAMWLQSLLLSFAVVDLTADEREDHGLSVSASITMDDKHVSDLDDNFVLESFWVQSAGELTQDPAGGESEQLGNTSSLFGVRVSSALFAAWRRCSAADMLAAGSVFNLKIASFEARERNYSWLPRHDDSIGLLNISWLCGRGESTLALSECDGLLHAAEVYVRQRAYDVPGTTEDGEVPCQDPSTQGRLCERTEDPVLLGLLHVQQHVRGAPSAGQHYGSASQVRYRLPLPPGDFAQLQQAHAWAPYADCAVLLTTEGRAEEGAAPGQNAVRCLGVGGVTEIVTQQDPTSRFLGAFGYELGGRRYVMLLLAGRWARSATLGWNDAAAGVFRVVTDAARLSRSWVSVCVERIDGEQLVAALGMDANNAAEVRFFRMELRGGDANQGIELHPVGGVLVFPLTYAILEQEPAGFGNDTQPLSLGFSTVDPWMRYSRVVVARGSRTVLVAGVTSEQVIADSTGPGGSRLLLNVCAGASEDTACAHVQLSGSPADPPSFVSAAPLRRGEDSSLEYWVVGVHGLVYTVTSRHGAGVRVTIEAQPQSDLAGVHFVKVDTLFYTLSTSGTPTVGVLTYLPGFERLQRNTSQVLAYAVVVVPPAVPRADPVGEDNATYTPPPTVLRLLAHHASYHVEVAAGPGLPVYELAGSRAAGNESTQLLVSPHAPAPFATRKAGFLATYEGSGLAHRLGLPHAVGRYEMADTCSFTHTTAKGADGVLLTLQSAPQSPLLLLFSVPCGGMLKIRSPSLHEPSMDITLSGFERQSNLNGDWIYKGLFNSCLDDDWEAMSPDLVCLNVEVPYYFKTVAEETLERPRQDRYLYYNGQDRHWSVTKILGPYATYADLYVSPHQLFEAPVHWQEADSSHMWFTYHSCPTCKASTPALSWFVKNATPLLQHECPGDVFLEITSAARQEAHYLIPGTDRVHTVVTAYATELLTVFMGRGVAWVNSVYAQATPAEVRRRLLRARQLLSGTPATPVGKAWQRERQVLTLNPVKDMRLELRFARRETVFADAQVSVGVDDVQLTPVLSQVPALQGGEGQLCAGVRVPSAQELAQVGLEGLVASDHWERVHVTVGLQTQHAQACAYQLRLYLAQDSECPAAASANASGVGLIGCEVTTDAGNVRGAYAECQLHVPMALASEVALGVVAWPRAGPEESAACRLDANDSLVVSLRPHTAVYECPSGHFVDERGGCQYCHGAEGAACAPGTRLEGCPALAAGGRCVNCTEGADLVLAQQAHWVASTQSICAWKCSAGFYETELLGKRACAPCSPASACGPGQRSQSCREFEDTKCVTCPDLVLSKGFYAANEIFVDGCDSACKPGHYNNTERHANGRCMRCWDRTELILDASRSPHRFLAFSNCTATANARWTPCAQEAGSRLVDSDPGAGTPADPFTGRCRRECEDGYVLAAGGCSPCPHPPRVEHGSPTSLPLEAAAFTWHRGSCNFTCAPPYVSTRARGGQDPAVVDTCVLCRHLNGSHLCPSGSFPAGPYCACDTCRRANDLY